MELPPLKQTCPRCDGKMTVRLDCGTGAPYDRKCPDCDGRGEVATEAGTQVLEFLRMFYRFELRQRD